jgi:hypothetical protein
MSPQLRSLSEEKNLPDNHASMEDSADPLSTATELESYLDPLDVQRAETSPAVDQPQGKGSSKRKQVCPRFVVFLGSRVRIPV